MKTFLYSVFFVVAFVFFAPVVNAGFCSGSLSCYSNHPVSKCSISGVDCSSNGLCPGGPGDVCQTTNNWVQDYTSDCSFANNDVSVCNNATVTCPGAGGVSQSVKCSYVGSTPTPTPGPTPPGNAGCGACNTCGITQWCAQENGSCVVDSCLCAGIGCPVGGGSDPCPNDTCAGSCCNYTCGQVCIVTADCKNPSSAGFSTYCNPVTHTCSNASCPNNTIPGSICGCSGGLVCGQKCAGGCTNNSTCRFTDGPGCGDALNTYCIGDTGNNFNTFSSDYTTPLCTAGGNSYLRRVSTGQTSGFTIAQINATCPPPPSPAWWQNKDGDVVTEDTLTSKIPSTCVAPCTSKFILDGAGGFPGIAIYGSSFTPDFGTGTTSSKNWLANSFYLGKTYNYSYFENLIPSDVFLNPVSGSVNGGTFNSGGTPSRGYVWYKATGDLTISSSVNLVGSRKVILLVSGGNLNIQGNIKLQSPGNGFFMAIVGKDSSGNKGDILVDPSVNNGVSPALEGIFMADDQFLTGPGNSQLYIRGSVAAYGGIGLQRDLGGIANNTTPSEFIEYAPDLILTYPRSLTRSRVTWHEIAP